MASPARPRTNPDRKNTVVYRGYEEWGLYRGRQEGTTLGLLDVARSARYPLSFLHQHHRCQVTAFLVRLHVKGYDARLVSSPHLIVGGVKVDRV